MVSVRSLVWMMRMLAGIEACSSGSSARMRSTTSMTFAPGWRCSTSSTAGLPSARPRLRMFSTPSLTVATSCSRTGALLR